MLHVLLLLFRSTNAIVSHTNETTNLAPHNPQRIIKRMGVSSSSFQKFMDPTTLMGWDATKNGTYWAAAKLLARLAHEKEVAKIMSAYEEKNAKIVLAHEKKLAKIMGRKTAETAEASSP